MGRKRRGGGGTQGELEGGDMRGELRGRAYDPARDDCLGSRAVKGSLHAMNRKRGVAPAVRECGDLALVQQRVRDARHAGLGLVVIRLGLRLTRAY